MLLLLLCSMLVSMVAAEHCKYSGKVERTLSALTLALFQEKWLLDGDILDVGANDGSWSCMYACFDRKRTVYAVDPDPQHQAQISRCSYPNVKAMNFALSNESGVLEFNRNNRDFVDMRNEGKKLHSKNIVRIESLDNLFLNIWKAKPAFMHIDVEGHELKVLQGARKIIDLYHPVLTVEVHVEDNQAFTRNLVAYLAEDLRYRCFLVNELCGYKGDCRNLLCFPSHIAGGNKASDDNFLMHPAFDVALRHGGISDLVLTRDNVMSVYEKMKPRAIMWQEYDKFFLVSPTREGQ